MFCSIIIDKKEGDNMENITMLDMQSNDMLSELSKNELEELRKEIRNSSLSYRSSIGLEAVDTFGTEIEYENFSRSVVDDYIAKKHYGYVSSYDDSVPTGGEIKSPISQDMPEFWKEFQEICFFLAENGAETAKNSGGHIHIGSHILKNNYIYWRQFFKTYMLYETELFEFFKGEFKEMRPTVGEYAEPIAKALYQDLEKLNNLTTFDEMHNSIFIPTKKVAVNLKKVVPNTIKLRLNSTIEFRSPNGTSKEIIWQNNINTAVKLLKAPVKELVDEDYLDYRLREGLPTESSLSNALELVDTIFDNNLDKIYFLKQYNKDFNFKEEKCRGLVKSKF